MKSTLVRLIGLVTLFSIIGIAGGATFSAKSADAADGCLYASFNNSVALGIVRVCNVTPGNSGTVRVNLYTTTSGNPELCSTDRISGTTCSGVNPFISAFPAGCSSYDFPMGLASTTPAPTRVELVTGDGTVAAALTKAPSAKVKRLVADRCFFNEL